MSILLVTGKKRDQPLKEAILKLDPDLHVEVWPHVEKPERVQFAVAWDQPKRIFQSYPNLKAVSSLGAGVDHLIQDESIPQDLNLTRIPDTSLITQMNDYIMAAVINMFTRLSDYIRSEEWDPKKKYRRDEMTIGVLGLGKMGSQAARILSQHGYRVLGLSKSGKGLQGVETFSRSELEPFLNKVNLLINLLPLTKETEGILNLENFKKLKTPAFLINVARGDHLIDEDLIYAIDTEIIHHAYLDVFSEEPLPSSHPLRGREEITITPHIAAVSHPEDIAVHIVENYKRLLSGMGLQNVVDREKGY